METKKVIVIISITSDIGTELAKRYSKQNYKIIGTYRSTNNIEKLKQIPNCNLFFCDLNSILSIKEFIKKFRNLNLEWDLLIIGAGTQKPIGRFFDVDFDEWSSSVHANSIEQLKVLHYLYQFRNKEKVSDVVFFAGPGINNAVSNYSAYIISKIILIKMCELIDFETLDLNIFITGPGWTKTKMHYETLEAGPLVVGENYERTKKFMESETGTSMDDIFNCIEWLRKKSKKIASGRNFSIVHDKWKNAPEELARALESDINMYKLRRFKNDFNFS